jgi:hypothetical protein
MLIKAKPESKTFELLVELAGAAVHAPLEITKFGPHVAHVLVF